MGFLRESSLHYHKCCPEQQRQRMLKMNSLLKTKNSSHLFCCAVELNKIMAEDDIRWQCELTHGSGLSKFSQSIGTHWTVGQNLCWKYACNFVKILDTNRCWAASALKPIKVFWMVTITSLRAMWRERGNAENMPDFAWHYCDYTIQLWQFRSIPTDVISGLQPARAMLEWEFGFV